MNTNNGWLDIASAPKDGTEFQAWLNVDWWEPRCRFNPASEAFEIWGRVDYDRDDWETCGHLTATHWMPRPAAPGSPAETVADEGAQKVYHFEQRSKFGPWIEVEKPTDKSVEFVQRSVAPAAGDARDAARYRNFRAALCSLDATWLDNVQAALEGMGLDPDDDVLPTAEQVDAAFDSASQQGGE